MNEPSASHRRLRPPKHGVERRAIGWWMLQSVVYIGPILAAAIAAYLFWPNARFWVAFVIAAVAVFLVIAITVEPFWRYRVHRWETTPDAVYARSGWLVREWRAAPLSRVQTVDAIQGPLEQVMGLATLRVTTASSSGAIDIVGLTKATAEREAEQLTQIAQLTPGDAT
ncbi:MAG: PH domain-containing protein [Gulosibacter sp.]|uniref:PH domain-containing protein n=1 Tax=Gulosibacter sp. TaxID=2817531 RepID=UPI003F932AB7